MYNMKKTNEMLQEIMIEILAFNMHIEGTEHAIDFQIRKSVDKESGKEKQMLSIMSTHRVSSEGGFWLYQDIIEMEEETLKQHIERLKEHMNNVCADV